MVVKAPPCECENPLVTHVPAIVLALYFVFVHRELGNAESGFLQFWFERERRRRGRFNSSTSKRGNPPTKRIPEV